RNADPHVGTPLVIKCETLPGRAVGREILGSEFSLNRSEEVTARHDRSPSALTGMARRRARPDLRPIPVGSAEDTCWGGLAQARTPGRRKTSSGKVEWKRAQ